MNVLKGFALLSVAILCIVAADTARRVGDAAEGVRADLAKTEASTVREIALTREASDARLKDVVRQLSKTNETLDGATRNLVAVVDERSKALDRAADSFDLLARSSSANMDQLRSDVDEVKDRLLEREPMVYSRILATTGEAMKALDATRLTMNEVAKAAPDTAEAVRSTSQSVEAIADHVEKLTRPTSWWKSVLMIASGGALKAVWK